MMKVLIPQKIGKEALEVFDGIAEVVFSEEGNMDEFMSLLKDATAVVLGSTIKFTSELMDTGKNLKVISRTGAGVDNVDIDSATIRKILVLHTPEANSLTVAEHTVTLIASIAKQLLFLDSELRKGNFKKSRRLNLPVDIDNKVLGLIGCGKIGKLVAKKCISAFNMQVIGYDPYITNSNIEGIKLYGKIEEVFKNADFISLHVPYTESTKDLVNENLLSLMKPSAYIINAARGGIIDEIALIKKLKNNEIAGAALDVFNPEPPDVTSELLTLPNIILTPHTAALTKECSLRVASEATKGVADYLKGKTPEFVFNKEVLNN